MSAPLDLTRFRQKYPKVVLDEATKSFVVSPEQLVEVMKFLRDDPELRLDYCSNVAGVDWLDRVEKSKDAAGAEISKTIPNTGYLEVVYHLYSVSKKHGPVALRCRTKGRTNAVLPSVTPLFRSAEFQEREIFDLYGIRFEGHQDLRRILMWDEFKDFPMRKDYVEPDDFEWEPTAHDDVLERAKEHYQ
jgi:NADH-quinone oxidoreductase subunit C